MWKGLSSQTACYTALMSRRVSGEIIELHLGKYTMLTSTEYISGEFLVANLLLTMLCLENVVAEVASSCIWERDWVQISNERSLLPPCR